jgi:hypothetical protein
MSKALHSCTTAQLSLMPQPPLLPLLPFTAGNIRQ